jgi:hypothetical protein
MSESRIVLQQPLPHQVRELAVPSRFKAWCWGRRTGKSRGCVVAGTIGHGERTATGFSLPGAVSGGDVVWLAPDYPQATTIWNETFVPRFSGIDGIRVVNDTHDIELPNGGAIRLRSSENVNAVRGSGERLMGVILDEFAHHARAEYVWRSVVRPALMDNGAWAIWPSTPKRGSFFNERCLKIRRGEQTGPWHLSQMDARANTRIQPDEFAALVEEYPAESDELREEVFAELLEGGAGLAFPEFDRSVHTSPDRRMPLGWRYCAGLDWGYSKGHGFYVLCAIGPEGQIRVVWEKRFGELHARAAAKLIAEESRHEPTPEWIVYDEAMDHDGKSISGESVGSEFLAGLREAYGAGCPMWVAGPHKTGSRVAKKNLLHRLLAFRRADDGTIPPWAAPRFTLGHGCPELIRTLEKLPRDPKKPEDVDTNKDDHGYDAVMNVATADPPRAPMDAPQTDGNRHPGFDVNGQRRGPAQAPWEEQLMAQLMGTGGTDMTPGARYSAPRHWEPEA